MSLETIRERLNAATPGPWLRTRDNTIVRRLVNARIHVLDDHDMSDANVELCAHAREDLELLWALAHALAKSNLHHSPKCALQGKMPSEASCTCGFDAVIKALAAVQSAP